MLVQFKVSKKNDVVNKGMYPERRGSEWADKEIYRQST